MSRFFSYLGRVAAAYVLRRELGRFLKGLGL